MGENPLADHDAARRFRPMIPWLSRDTPFPPLEQALTHPNGLLCAGADLSPQRIIDAYRQGIFPWFSAGEPILWWSPDPRMVLFPGEFKISRSLRRSLRAGDYAVRLDSAFAEVIRACAETPRAGQPGTWITTEMQRAYRRLFELGVAHSVETWVDGKLVGGLYGMAIGRMFYGESMFSRATDASKIAVAHLARFLEEQGFGMIDCQMNTPHLASLGAREIPRRAFIAGLHELVASGAPPAHWPCDGAAQTWN
jgi:leucyl/phenylalanyl-tRNA---protein transferase